MLGVKAYQLHKAYYLIPAFLAVGAEVVYVERFADYVLGSHAGIQRGIGVLEHHLHLGAHLMNVLFCDFLALKAHGAAGGVVQVKQRAAYGGLAAAGLTYKTQCLAGLYAEGYVVNGLERHVLEAGAHLEILFQMFNFYEIFAHIIQPPQQFRYYRGCLSSRTPCGTR